MKIIFVKPRYFDREMQTFWTHVLPPDGIARLCTVLRKNGYSCKIYDMEPLKADSQDLASYLIEEKPDVVGIEVQTPLIYKSKLIAQIAKKVVPNALILCGGAHTFLNPDNVFDEIPEVDYILRGEAEITLPLFLDKYSKGKRKHELAVIDGLCFKDGQDKIISSKIPLIQDMGIVQMGSYDLLPLNKYYDAFYPAKKLYAPVTCRGCPNYCKFCGEPLVYGHKPRAISIEQVINELEVLIKDFQVDYISFQDATFNFDIQRTKNICTEIIKRRLKFAWKAKMRVDRVDEDMFRLMKESGCVLAGFGVESASVDSLKFLKKGFTIEQVRYAFNLANKTKIRTMAYLMIGSEGESESDFDSTIDFSIKLNPTYAHYMITTPMYGTELHEMYKDKLKDVAFDKYLFFTGISGTSGIGTETLKKYHRKAYIKFYLRPRFILREIANNHSIKDLILKFKYGFFMIYKMLIKS